MGKGIFKHKKGNKPTLGKHWKLSEETKQKMSIAKKGKPNGRLGKKLSEETKQKISKSHIGIKNPQLSENNRNRKGKFHHSEEAKQRMRGNRNSLRYKHSEEHKQKIRGEKHWNWKGGITPINTQIRTSLEYKLWRKSVFERDNFICQKTKQKGGELVAHHINNFAEKGELRFAIDNGITLSEKAHKEFHQLYGRKNNTREQLEEFL